MNPLSLEFTMSERKADEENDQGDIDVSSGNIPPPQQQSVVVQTNDNKEKDNENNDNDNDNNENDNKENEKKEMQQKQQQRAMEMVHPHDTRTLTVYRKNKFGGKGGQCRFDVQCMHGYFPVAVINFTHSACNSSYFPHRPSMGCSSKKKIKHPKDHHYVITQRFIREYCDGTSDGNYKSKNYQFFFYKDDIEAKDDEFEPQTVTMFLFSNFLCINVLFILFIWY